MKRPPRRGRPFSLVDFTDLLKRQFHGQARVRLKVQDTRPPRIAPVVHDLIRCCQCRRLSHVLGDGDGSIGSTIGGTGPVLVGCGRTDDLAVNIKVEACALPILQFRTSRLAIPQYDFTFVFAGSIKIVRSRIVIHRVRIRAPIDLTTRERQGRNHQRQPPKSRVKLAHVVLIFKTEGKICPPPLEGC